MRLVKLTKNSTRIYVLNLRLIPVNFLGRNLDWNMPEDGIAEGRETNLSMYTGGYWRSEIKVLNPKKW